MNPTIRTVKMSSKGQVVIPQEFREALSLKQGDALVILQRRKELIIRAADEVAAKMEWMSDKEWQEMGMRNMAEVWDNPEDIEFVEKILKLPPIPNDD